MKFTDFEQVMSPIRMRRYLVATGNNTKKAMTLYRFNLRLSQQLFTVISCFEVALRNAIDIHCMHHWGNDWLKNAALPGGIFDNRLCRLTATNINGVVNKLNRHYNHHKLVAELGFGFWRYLFAQHQYYATGRTLLRIFPVKPASSATIQYNHTYVFNQLATINNIRNRIAHHEPICFVPAAPVKDTMYVRQHYQLILQLFQWMAIDEAALLYGLDHIIAVCDNIDAL
jgi:hypothetical protein